MGRVLQTSKWFLFGTLCVSVGLYPLLYFIIDRNFGLLATKYQELLTDLAWNSAFYGHIVLGGSALLVGWIQFSPRIRRTRLSLHRNIGKFYVIAVLISGVCGLFVAQSATGGITNVIGFSLSALVWLTTTLIAFYYIKNRKIQLHKEFMIYSYAVCFSAVTLKIWLPILTILTGEFIVAYKIVGWLSWVPNLLVAYLIILRERRKIL